MPRGVVEQARFIYPESEQLCEQVLRIVESRLAPKVKAQLIIRGNIELLHLHLRIGRMTPSSRERAQRTIEHLRGRLDKRYDTPF